MDRHKIWRIERVGIAILILGAIFGALYFLRLALIPVFIALFLAYVLDPVVNRLEGKRIHRQGAIFILAFATIILLGLAVVFLLYEGQKEVVSLYRNMPRYLAKIQEEYGPLVRKYMGVAIPRSFDEIFTQMKAQLGKVDPGGLKPMTNLISELTTRTITLLGWVFSLSLTPVFLFYFLRDWDELKSKLAGYVPLAYRDYLIEKARQTDEVLSGFIRGQMTVCLILGVLYSLGLRLIDVNLAIVIGMLSGAAYIVPYLGTVVGVVAACAVSLLQYGLDWHFFAVWLVFGVVQALEGSIITPKVVGEKVGLSPVVVIIALLVAGNLLGFLGVLIAVPAAAVLNVFVKDGLGRYKKSAFFLEQPERFGEFAPPKPDRETDEMVAESKE